MTDPAAEEIIRGIMTAFGGPLMARDAAIKFVEAALHEVRRREQDRCCKLIDGHCGSDNVAARTVAAIRRGDE